MLRIMLVCACVAPVVGSFAGCGSGTGEVNTKEVAVEETPAKKMLSDVAESGQLGSDAMAIRDALETMKETDSAKAGELLKDLDALEGLSDAAKIKAKAKKMADKL